MILKVVTEVSLDFDLIGQSEVTTSLKYFTVVNLVFIFVPFLSKCFIDFVGMEDVQTVVHLSGHSCNMSVSFFNVDD